MVSEKYQSGWSLLGLALRDSSAVRSSSRRVSEYMIIGHHCAVAEAMKSQRHWPLVNWAVRSQSGRVSKEGLIAMVRVDER